SSTKNDYVYKTLPLCSCTGSNRYLHSFPTRRSSDLAQVLTDVLAGRDVRAQDAATWIVLFWARRGFTLPEAMVSALCAYAATLRSEEHTSELQSRENLVCRLLLEKKNQTKKHK